MRHTTDLQGFDHLCLLIVTFPRQHTSIHPDAPRRPPYPPPPHPSHLNPHSRTLPIPSYPLPLNDIRQAPLPLPLHPIRSTHFPCVLQAFHFSSSPTCPSRRRPNQNQNQTSVPLLHLPRTNVQNSTETENLFVYERQKYETPRSAMPLLSGGCGRVLVPECE